MNLPTDKPTSGTGTEMNLAQWVATLPDGHRAKREYFVLQCRLLNAQAIQSILIACMVVLLVCTAAYLFFRP